MAVTSRQIIDFLLANPGMSDADIVAAMETYKVSPAQMAEAVGLKESQVAARVAATVPQGSSVTLGDTVIVPKYQTTGSGMDEQVGALESFASSKTTGDINYKAPVGTPVNVYSADGEFLNTVKTKKDQSFIGGLVDAFKDPVVQAAILGVAGGAGAFDGLLSGSPTIGNGAFLGEGVASGVPAFDAAFTSAGGTFNPAFGLPVGNGAFLGEGVPTGIPASDAALLNAGGTLNPAFTLAPDGLLGTPPIVNVAGVPPTGVPPTAVPPTGVPPTGVPPTGVPPVATPPTGVPPVAPPTGVPPVIPPISTVIPPIADLLKTGLTAAQIAQLLSTGTQTAAGLLQQQTSKEAAQKAQAMIDAETAAAKQSAAFRPIGMTTRFGASQFGFDPKTGQLTSAGYTLSPEAKAAQDRFVKLAESGIQQAEGAQQAFAPLQTGAQSLFGLGNKYLAQNPQDVAQNYLNQQMALLQPGRELELANLQNRLQQQGRGGLSVAQGGTMGATTPELQALYNARAMQEAQLGANAQQFGQQQVQFGAGLLGTGAQTMGQYYGGQQAAYAPYTTALGQVQGLETAAQQPFTMGAGLGQTAAQAGFNVGQLGLRGAGASVDLATGKAATTNPYATALSGLAGSNVFNGLISGLPSVTAMSAPATTFGTGNYYGNQDLGLYL
jgi:hypothetical protein